ncbi:MAG TPA: hypothetical protein VMG82_01575, partial [Candidatus Sulfotelmatobacter sp.]|nr:hypothetical protein [Candidatus Sulfotelmatobacter sp.]
KCAAIERRLSRRKKAQPVEATIKAAANRGIRQNLRDFPGLSSARLESEGQKVIDAHLKKLRDRLLRDLRVEIASQSKKLAGFGDARSE